MDGLSIRFEAVTSMIASRGRALMIAPALVATIGMLAPARQRTDSVAALRLYIFDNGAIRGLDTKLFGFTREELKRVDSAWPMRQ
jgi:hypothetical protein